MKISENHTVAYTDALGRSDTFRIARIYFCFLLKYVQTRGRLKTKTTQELSLPN